MQKNWIGRSEGLRCAGKSPIRRWPVVPTTSRSTPPVPTPFMARRSWRLPPITRWQKKLAAKDPAIAEFCDQCRRAGTSLAALETAEKTGLEDRGQRGSPA
jgi:leucyl-tRNA synthetase